MERYLTDNLLIKGYSLLILNDIIVIFYGYSLIDSVRVHVHVYYVYMNVHLCLSVQKMMCIHYTSVRIVVCLLSAICVIQSDCSRAGEEAE